MPMPIGTLSCILGEGRSNSKILAVSLTDYPQTVQSIMSTLRASSFQRRGLVCCLRLTRSSATHSVKARANAQATVMATHGRPKILQRRDGASGKEFKTVLAIDGGGMRGIIPARVLEVVEDAIRETIIDCKDSVEFKNLYHELPDVRVSGDIPVDLADYFDLMAGTSTGSIVAAYLATKGGFCDDNILQSARYREGLDEFIQHAGNVQLAPGSAKSAQALFVATRKQIFAWGPSSIMQLAAFLSACFAKIPIVSSVYSFWCGLISTVYMLLRPKYWENGIDEVLQRSFGGGVFAPTDGVLAGTEGTEESTSEAGATSGTKVPIQLSDSATGAGGRKGGLFTSLLIPTFHIDYNRAVAFWHKHSDEDSSRAWGYTTLNRLRPPATSTQLGAKPALFADTNTVTEFQPDSLRASEAPRPAMQLWKRADNLTELEEPLAPPEAKPLKAPSPVFNLEESGNIVHVWDVDFPLWSIVRASTAAPTFFPAASISSTGVGSPTTQLQTSQNGIEQPYSLLHGSFADGGLVANNPTLAAMAFMRRTTADDPAKLAVLSLGCGAYIEKLQVNRFAGQLGWVKSIISVSLGAGVEASSAIGEQLFQQAMEAAMGSAARGNPSSSSSNGSLNNSKKPPRFLRVQAVGFAPNATLDFDQPNVPHVPVGRTGSATYLPIGGQPTSTPEDQELAAALAKMDRVDDWQNLLTVGGKLGDHFKEDLKAWVKAYVLGL